MVDEGSGETSVLGAASDRGDRIKVLHLITHLGFGGGTDNTLATVEGLRRERYEVHLGSGDEHEDKIDEGRGVADALFLFPRLRRAPRPIDDLLLLRQLTRFLREQRYDVVHTHNAKAGVIGRLAAKRADAPVILHTMHLLSWQDAGGRPTGRRQRLTNLVTSRLYLFLERLAANRSDMIVTVCDQNRAEVLRSKIAPPERVVTVYSGIDYSRFDVESDRTSKCDELALDPDRPIVAMIGRLSPQKAPLDFVAAARLVLAQRPDAQFLMIGDGPLADDVAGAIADEPRIRALGHRDDVPEILPFLDVFVLSSLWEGLGRALTEAMVLGVPVAVTAVNGMPELVTHRETGMLSPPFDPAAQAENILWLLEHPAEARQLGSQGRERVLPQFSAGQMVDRLDALYESLVAARRTGERVAPRSALPNDHTAARH
ncbi:MAG: glycosyltransferase family 4 protein [Acidimicrobiia bacterium]